EAVREIANRHQCDVLLSAGKYLDILPGGVNKGTTLKKLINAIDFPEDRVLVAGDTYNDHSLFETGYKGVAVGKSEPALLNAVDHMGHVFQATKEGAGGILEAMQHFESFRGYHPVREKEVKKKDISNKQLLMVYHRLPFDIVTENGKPKRVPPVAPMASSLRCSAFSIRAGRAYG